MTEIAITDLTPQSRLRAATATHTKPPTISAAKPSSIT
jgi:hypothetical protein